MADHLTPPTADELAAWQAATDAAKAHTWIAQFFGPGAHNGQDFMWMADKAVPRLLAEVARLRVLFAWESGELTEKQAADLIANGDRLNAREMRLHALEMAKALAPKPVPAHTITDEAAR